MNWINSNQKFPELQYKDALRLSLFRNREDRSERSQQIVRPELRVVRKFFSSRKMKVDLVKFMPFGRSNKIRNLRVMHIFSLVVRHLENF